MKRMILTATALVLVAALPGRTQTASTMRLPVRQDSKLWIEGSSNLHDWNCKATNYEATIDVDNNFAASVAKGARVATLLRRVDVKVLVTGLKCGHDGMEKNLYKALNAEETPQVRYITGSFDAAPSDSASAFQVKTTGTLLVAGKENPVQLDVRATLLPDGSIHAQGEVAILMTQYGIKPPTAMLGALRTKDKVVVKFDLFVGTAVVAAGGSPR